MEKLGCDCINRDQKLFIIRVLKEVISNQKDAINRVETNFDELSGKGWQPDQLLQSSKDYMKKLEDTRTAVQNTPDCKQSKKSI